MISTNKQEIELGCLLFNGTKDYIWKEAQDYCQSQGTNTLYLMQKVLLVTVVQLSSNLGKVESKHLPTVVITNTMKRLLTNNHAKNLRRKSSSHFK